MSLCYRSLYCNDTGRFSAEHAHNYQHASSYPAFMVSGTPLHCTRLDCSFLLLVLVHRTEIYIESGGVKSTRH